jgi:hypothetical protein
VSEIAEFLRARYAERRALAEAARDGGKGCWTQEDPGRSPGRIVDERGETVVYDEGAPTEEQGTHIAANDPAFVIADCNAKLALVDEVDYNPPSTDDSSDQELHARCAHPDWEYRTTSGPRKQWDDVDDPPCDDYGNPEPGWERNIDAGMPGQGWERFDYTEESYWRRPRPNGPQTPYIPRTLRLLAQPFAGHPDHKGEEWTP